MPFVRVYVPFRVGMFKTCSIIAQEELVEGNFLDVLVGMEDQGWDVNLDSAPDHAYITIKRYPTSDRILCNYHAYGYVWQDVTDYEPEGDVVNRAIARDFERGYYHNSNLAHWLYWEGYLVRNENTDTGWQVTA